MASTAPPLLPWQGSRIASARQGLDTQPQYLLVESKHPSLSGLKDSSPMVMLKLNRFSLLQLVLCCSAILSLGPLVSTDSCGATCLGYVKAMRKLITPVSVFRC